MEQLLNQNLLILVFVYLLNLIKCESEKDLLVRINVELKHLLNLSLISRLMWFLVIDQN